VEAKAGGGLARMCGYGMKIGVSDDDGFQPSTQDSMIQQSIGQTWLGNIELTK